MSLSSETNRLGASHCMQPPVPTRCLEVIRAELNILGLHFSQKSEMSAEKNLGFEGSIFNTNKHLVKSSASPL